MKNSISYILFGVSSLLVVACGEPDYPTPTPSVNTLTSKLTVVHALKDGPRVKVKMDNKITEKDTVRFEKAADGKYYNTITLAVPAGPNRLINFANFDNTNLVTDRYSATANTNNTAFLINTIVNSAEVTAVRRVADDLTTPDVGFAKVRFFNFGFNSGEVRVTTVDAAATVFSPRKYNEVSRATTDFARFTTVPAGTYNYEIRSIVGDTVVMTINSIKFDSKGIYTIYMKGEAVGGANQLEYAVIKH
jgi:hypothetical protein